MSLAFWRRKNPAADATSARSTRPADDDARDPAAALRARARRRLIGAAALLLAAVIVVPMVLDPEPKPVSDAIPIDIPSEKSKFTPRLAPPPATDAAPVVPPPDAPAKSDAAKLDAVKADASKPAGKADATPSAEPARTDAAKADEQRARAALEGKAAAPAATKADAAAPTKADKGGAFAVQAAATSNLAAARDLSERLKKAGLTPYTERVETAEGTRFRVRVGPYSTREAAEKARARLKSLGINGNIVGP